MERSRVQKKQQPGYPAERKKRRKRWLWSLLALLLTVEIISTGSVAWQVKRAMLCTDTYYLPSYLREEGYAPKPKDFAYEIVWYEEGEFSIPISFNNVWALQSAEDTIKACVIPLVTLYGVGEKKVFLLYSEEVYDAQGERVCGSWNIPVTLWFKWDNFRWELYDRLEDP